MNNSRLPVLPRNGRDCNHCVDPASAKNERTVTLIADAYASSSAPWFLGFSGGKDSSALLALTYAALKQAAEPKRPVTIVYCDTGVEIPIVSQLVRSTLERLEEEARLSGVPIVVEVAEPRIQDRFFVKVIGRGYPTPTNKFRWCTDRLRIDPVQRLIGGHDGPNTVLLGVRRGESEDRDRTLERHSGPKPYFFRQTGYPESTIFAPLIDYNVEDVWATIHHGPGPTALNGRDLADLYRAAGTECPIIRDPKGTPCGKGRFGCWTCTVVRQDRAVSGLVADGYPELAPLLEFRNWLARFRDDPSARAPRRRNGSPGPGPFTMRARQEILHRLLRTQSRVAWRLITPEEVEAIEAMWKAEGGSRWGMNASGHSQTGA